MASIPPESPARPASAVPVDFASVARPGAILSNAWPHARSVEGGTLHAIEQCLTRWPFFQAIQTLDVPYPAERRAIGRMLAGRDIPYSYTLTRLLAEHKVNLSSLDPGERRRAVTLVRNSFDDALEAGTHIVAFIPGARPAEPLRRAEALDALARSLEELAEAARAVPGLVLLLEPLDYEAHKRNTLGTTAEAVALCERLAARQLALSLCLDTSQLILNEEDPVAAARQAAAFTPEFHFCNPVLDRTSPFYGDQHPPFGPPGVVDVDRVAAIMAGLWRIGYLGPSTRPRVFAEVLKPAHLDSPDTLNHCLGILSDGWTRARRLLT